MNHETRERVADRLELAASISWLFMDLAWMEQSTALALACALPTTVCSLAAVPFVRSDFTARAVSAAMAAWAVMNSLWMMTDLGVYQALMPARACFAVGLGLLLAALVVSGSARAVLSEVTRTFRRMRAGRR